MIQCDIRYRNKTIYKNKMPKLDKDWKDDVDYWEVKEVRRVPYTKYIYTAKERYTNNSYRITKKDYLELRAILDKP